MDHPISNESISLSTWKGYDSAHIHYTIKNDFGCSFHLGCRDINVLLLHHTVTVRPNTAYVVSADCRTKDVVDLEQPDDPLGANISVGSHNTSRGVVGTSDTTTLRILGLSDANGKLTVTLGLGYWTHAGTGEAWFDNIRYIPADEYVCEDSTWHLLGIIMANTAFQKDGSTMTHQMSPKEIQAGTCALRQATEDLNELARGLLHADMDVLVSYGRFDAYTYTDALGYCLSHENAYAYCKRNHIDLSAYDHVLFIQCQPNMPHTYFGLGGCFIRRYIGHSNVLFHEPRALTDSVKPGASWSSGVYIHEFLHAAESYSDRFGLPHPGLHSQERFGYVKTDHWRSYYRDFIRNSIRDGDRYAGIHPTVWRIPPHVFN